MSDIELSSVISLIMENPELVAQIKKLAESRTDESSTDAKDTEIEVGKAEEPVLDSNTQTVENSASVRKTHTRGKRSELLHALSPYISEGRQKALETFMTIADILDMMREK